MGLLKKAFDEFSQNF